jgi:hypothetical protein
VLPHDVDPIVPAVAKAGPIAFPPSRCLEPGSGDAAQKVGSVAIRTILFALGSNTVQTEKFRVADLKQVVDLNRGDVPVRKKD